MLAKNIRMYLKTNGIRQTWLAEKLNVPNTTLNGILNGRSELKAEMFMTICQILRVSPETFMEAK